MMSFGRVVMAGIAVGAVAWAADLRRPEQHELTVCMDRNSDFSLFRAQAVATELFQRIGVRLNWKHDMHVCALDEGALIVTIDYNDNPDWPAGVMAKAAPYQKRSIIVNYTRARGGAKTELLLLGYVLAHEIAHMAQAITRHSATGIMKAHWDGADIVNMRRNLLGFTDEDIELILHGLDNRSTEIAGAQ